LQRTGLLRLLGLPTIYSNSSFNHQDYLLPFLRRAAQADFSSYPLPTNLGANDKHAATLAADDPLLSADPLTTSLKLASLAPADVTKSPVLVASAASRRSSAVRVHEESISPRLSTDGHMTILGLITTT
jgi:hypothetical protein